MKKQKAKKYYTGGGVILIINDKRKRYIVFPKRSEGVDVINPGAHSGFFGGIDEENPKEHLYPNLISSRELSEELLIIPRKKDKIYGLKIKDGCQNDKIIENIKKLCDLWEKEKCYLITKDKIEFINVNIIKTIEYIETDGAKSILVVEVKLPLSLEKIYLLDGEVKREIPEWKEIIDRRIDIFDLKEFKKWWLSNKKLALDAKISFHGGREERRKGFISREKNKVSPSLILVLNKWWSN